MKSALFIFVFLAMILPNQASAQKKNVGVGIILDDPFHFQNTPVSVFYEYALLLDLTNSNLKSETALGIRYYF